MHTSGEFPQPVVAITVSRSKNMQPRAWSWFSDVIGRNPKVCTKTFDYFILPSSGISIASWNHVKWLWLTSFDYCLMTQKEIISFHAPTRCHFYKKPHLPTFPCWKVQLFGHWSNWVTNPQPASRMTSPSTSSTDNQVLEFLLLSHPKELQTKILALVLHGESITPSMIELRLNLRFHSPKSQFPSHLSHLQATQRRSDPNPLL